ncbi:MAG TPA: hypothetical protein VGJ45_17755 [Pseudonocardiaceae bacterium]
MSNADDDARVVIGRLPDADVMTVAGEIDLTRARFFSSSPGIAVLELAHRSIATVDRSVAATDQVVLRAAGLTGPIDELSIHPTTESALAE